MCEGNEHWASVTVMVSAPFYVRLEHDLGRSSEGVRSVEDLG